jgi:hypothetical protein
MRSYIAAAIPATLLCGLVGGCNLEADPPRPIDVWIPSVGRFRTTEFEIHKFWRYDLLVGVELVPTDEATCRAAIPLGARGEKLYVPADRPCKALAPPIGAIDWVLTKSGKVIASGSTPSDSWEWPNSSFYWRSLDNGVGLYPGPHYALEVNIHPSLAPIKTYQARLTIQGPVK